MTQDPFSGVGAGSFPALHTIDPSTKDRIYSGTECYKSAAHRGNLKVLTGALIENILFQNVKSKVEAFGVQFQQNGTNATAKAQREVILAA